MKSLLLLTACLIALMPVSGDCADFPALRARINDNAGVLSASQRQELENMAAALETRTSTQIFALIAQRMPSGASLETYADELFQFWQIGQKGKDNGVLLVMFIADRKIRIEVGYGGLMKK